MHMSPNNGRELDVTTRIIHLGLVLFGITAWLSGELAEDVEEGETFGYNIHSWLGLALAVIIALRLVYGLVGPANIRFSSWFPVTGPRLSVVWDDIRAMLLLKLPDGPLHHGLAGLVQAAGLLLFAWMAATGTWLYFSLVPGREAGGILHLVEELHEVGEGLIPLYLVLHVGAVVLHALLGRHKWRRMFFINRARDGET
ncbi:MAG: cytochrome b/b6 domain-containing protein [Gammaproteobacteria bacterium]|nr:cytochrome b/b6 domain-containing protein [Gammaproteobacteria bacterium]